MEYRPRLFFHVAKRAFRRDFANPTGGHIQRLRRLRVVNGDIALSINKTAAVLRRYPLQGVAGQPLIRFSLKHQPPKVFVAGGTLSLLNVGCDAGQVGPGLRRLFTVFLQQILAVVERTAVQIGRHRFDPAINHVVLPGGGEEILFDVAHAVGQIQQVFVQYADPYGVGLKQIDGAGVFGGKQLLEQRQLFIGGRRQVDKFQGMASLSLKALFDLVAVLAPFFAWRALHTQRVGQYLPGHQRQCGGNHTRYQSSHCILSGGGWEYRHRSKLSKAGHWRKSFFTATI
ncbi:hypothetical protein D3C72_1511310 [compost metagenome]